MDTFYTRCERALLLSYIIIESGILATIKIILLAAFGDEHIEFKYIEATIKLAYAIGKLFTSSKIMHNIIIF